LRLRLKEAGVPVADGASQILPVLIGDNDQTLAVADALLAAGFDVRAIRPPTVAPGTARLRISVNVNVTGELIDRFVAALSASLAAGAAAPVGFAGHT
jgi:8-amino-7-oxononanoate synthase